MKHASTKSKRPVSSQYSLWIPTSSIWVGWS
nr:MAG TPA: hypothetical protein [Caudoviricetes sp.]